MRRLGMMLILAAAFLVLIAPILIGGPGCERAAAQTGVEPVVPFGLFSSLPIDSRPDPLPFHAAYSHDIFVGSIPFTETHWSFGG